MCTAYYGIDNSICYKQWRIIYNYKNKQHSGIKQCKMYLVIIVSSVSMLNKTSKKKTSDLFLPSIAEIEQLIPVVLIRVVL